MKTSRKIILSIAIIIWVMFLGMSYFIGTQVFTGSTQLVTNEETTGAAESFWKKYHMDYQQFCNTYTIEKITITSTFDGHTIPADYIYALNAEKNKDNKTVVLVHGLGDNRYANYPLAELFLEKGYNVLTYDQRSSNENKAQYTTFGYWEKYDLIDCIQYVKEQAPSQMVGIWGTSFGGATVGLAMENKEVAQSIDFLILDCPVSSMKWMVEKEIEAMNIGLPTSYMTWCGNKINQLKLGFSYEDADVSKAIAQVQMPVLIINSKADTVTPEFMGKELYDVIQAEKKTIWTVEDSKHTDMWLDYNQIYREKVDELLKTVQNAH